MPQRLPLNRETERERESESAGEVLPIFVFLCAVRQFMKNIVQVALIVMRHLWLYIL